MLAAVCAALACLTRYPGIVIFATALILLVLQRGATPTEKIKNAAAYSAIVVVPISVWMLGNFLISGSSTGIYLTAGFLLPLGVAIAISVLLLLRSTKYPAKITRMVAFVIVIVLIGVWMLRNFLISGSLTGRLIPTDFPPLFDLLTTTSEFGRWAFGSVGLELLDLGFAKIFDVFIGGDPVIARMSFTLAMLLVVAVAVAYSLLYLNRRVDGEGISTQWKTWAVPTVFAAFYILALAVYLANIGPELPIRFLVPLYVPTLVAVTLILNEFFRYADKQKPLTATPFLQKWTASSMKKPAIEISAPALILMAGLSLWLSEQAYENYQNINDWMDNGSGYTSREWTDSEMIRYLKSHPPDGKIWTNRAGVLRFWISGKILSLDPSIAKSPRHVVAKARVAGEDVYFAWFHKGYLSDYGYGLGDIASLRGVETVAELEDGVLLKRVSNPSGDASTLNEEPLLQPVLKDARLLIRSIFSVYLNESENMLIYAKDYCIPADIAPEFFLHIIPIDPTNLPEQRQQHGYDNLDFTANDYEFLSERLCVAKVHLPNYPVATIRTGQYIQGSGQLWREGYDMPAQ